MIWKDESSFSSSDIDKRTQLGLIFCKFLTQIHFSKAIKNMLSSSIIIEILLLRAFLWVSSTFSTIKSELPHIEAHFGLKAPSGMHLLNVSTLIWAEWHSLSFLRYVIYMKPKESFFNRKFSPCSSSVTGATFCLALAVRHKSRGSSGLET